MQPQIITVHDIYKSIEDVGVQPYANTLCQDMGGGYYYVEVEDIGYFEFSPSLTDTELEYKLFGTTNFDIENAPPEAEGCRLYYKYRVWPVPKGLAWFCIDALKLKSQAAGIGGNAYDDPGRQSVYLTPGKELFGHKIEKLTEIPAELRPVVVERL